MPSLARKLLICAAVDGLVIQPLATKGQQTPQQQQQRPSQPVKIKYSDGTVSSISRDQIPDVSRPNSSFEAFGIIGFFTVSRLSYLISITGREQVAQIRGFPVYVITDVALTPCTSQTEAEKAITHTSVQLRRAAAAGKKPVSPADSQIESDTESETDGPSPARLSNDADDPGVQSDRETSEETRDAGGGGNKSRIAEDVIKNRGSYGRFAQKWFSRKGWRIDQKRNLLLSGTDEEDAQSDAADAASATATTTPTTSSQKEGADDNKDLSKTVVKENVSAPPAPSAGETMLPKLLRMAHIWFGTSRSFYFSYDVDLTRSLASRAATAAPADSLRHRTADPMFFWNRALLKPFFSNSAGEPLLLPVMQGFVGQRSFIVDRDPPQCDSQQDAVELNDMASSPASPAVSPAEEDGPTVTTTTTTTTTTTKHRPSEKEFLITVVSRRSIKRAGLRYLRRGVDDEGYAANFVETEQLLSDSAWDPVSKLFSFVQVRGSIPLFFTQSPYSLKPLPVLQHSPEANFRAFKNHFDHMRKAYGSIQLVNLVERHGVESVIGNEYEKSAEKFNDELVGAGEGSKPLAFEWFDFHSACRGMKFENVSLLLDILGKKIEETGSTVEKDGQVSRKQNGVLRTNCMDCLDRTNVCQSSFARFMLDLQLKEEGFDMSAQADQQNTWFNTLWADNGDAISKQYASTAAMKGDYTRTRKRDYRGMVNDLGLSLTRFYNGMVNDYFSQAAIDFFLGNVTSMVFDEFEATMMTKDPAVSVQRMREQAIETSQKIAVENPDREDFIGGWTLLSPPRGGASDTVKTTAGGTGPFEEVVLLLTDVALYLCRFDWKLDKVQSFERVDLAHVARLRVGTYITSTISSADVDEDRNVGLVVTYEPGLRDVVRTNTRSLSNVVDLESDQQQQQQQKQQQQNQKRRIIALKAPYARTSLSDAHAFAGDRAPSSTDVKPITESEQINAIASEIERLVLAIKKEFSAPPRRPRTSNEGAEGGNSEQGQGQREESGGSGSKVESESECESIIERGDIVSLAEAKKSTGLLEQWGHSIKKFVWA